MHQRREGGELNDIGAMFRKMRKRAGLSQEALAERLHISRSNVSRIESNKLTLTFEDAIRWAQNTNAQDMLVALIMNVDVSLVANFVSQITQVATIYLGGSVI